VQFDAPLLKGAFAKAGVTASINNALNDPSKQTAQAQACLAAGAKVVIETSLDNGSASAIEKLFTDKGGKAIDYDRQVTGGTASIYDTFDGKLVGKAQANGIIAAMKAKHTYKKSSIVAELWGGETDQNAFWFKSGNDAVLNPLFKHHKLKKGPQKFVPGWLANNAATIYDQMLLKTHNKIKAAIAANDNIAGAVIAREKAHHLKRIPLSGQDASAAGIQYILAGWQTGTVYKKVSLEANAAAAAGDRAAAREEAGVERLPDEQRKEGADAHSSGDVDHEEELQAALHAALAEEERSLHRSVRQVLQVAR
jgi:D-xylose transport system substrate-binding protein